MATPLRAKKKAPASPTAEMVEVTPGLAQHWLASNVKNRNLRPQIVARYARDMADGNWLLTGEAVKFAASGALLDGQHRLSAIVESGVTVRTLVVTGLPDEVQDVMDSGAARKAADVLGLRGVKNSAITAAAIRLAVTEIKGQHLGKFSTTHAEIIDFLRAHPEMEDAAEYAAFAQKRVDCPPGVIAYTIWRLAQIDADDSYTFWGGIAEKVGLSAGDPRLALLHRLAQARRSGEYISREGLVSAIFRTWNLYRAGKTAERIHINSRQGGVVPVPVPR